MIRTMSRKRFLVAIALCLAVASAKAEPAMWVIRDADSTIYLIGTMHLLKHDTEWNAEKVKKTVHESTELWLEVPDLDNDAALAPLMMKLGVDPAHPLSSKLNEEQRKKLEKIAGAYGFPVASLEPMQPWLAALMLAVTGCAATATHESTGEYVTDSWITTNLISDKVQQAHPVSH